MGGTSVSHTCNAPGLTEPHGAFDFPLVQGAGCVAGAHGLAARVHDGVSAQGTSGDLGVHTLRSFPGTSGDLGLHGLACKGAPSNATPGMADVGDMLVIRGGRSGTAPAWG